MHCLGCRITGDDDAAKYIGATYSLVYLVYSPVLATFQVMKQRNDRKKIIIKRHHNANNINLNQPTVAV